MSVKPKKGGRVRARWRATNGYFRFGLFMSGVVLALVAVLALGNVKVAGQPDVPRWQAFWNASPNEIGDTIAGVASTLAFLWIIVTVMIQGSELRLQRRELAMTRRELTAQREASEAMALAQSAQVSTMQSQLEIQKSESENGLRSAREVALWEEFRRLSEEIVDTIQENEGLANFLGFIDPDPTRYHSGSALLHARAERQKAINALPRSEAIFPELEVRIFDGLAKLAVKRLNEDGFEVGPEIVTFLVGMGNSLDSLLIQGRDLSDAWRIKTKRLKIPLISDRIKLWISESADKDLGGATP